jgi:hypothetical protein
MSTDEWEELYNDKYKRKYYKNKTTGEKLWTKPNYSGVAITSTSSAIDSSAANTPAITASWDWTELYSDKHKRKYWKNTKTGETTWKEPPRESTTAATGDTTTTATTVATSWDWTELYSDKHKRKYWKNTKTGETTWKEPPKPSATVTTSDTATSAVAAASWDWTELYSDKHKRK